MLNALENSNVPEDKINILYNLSVTYLDSTSDLCMVFANQALEVAKASNDSSNLCSAYYTLGLANQSKSHFEKASTYYLKSYNIAKNEHDHNIIIHCSNNLGILNRYIGDYGKATKWYETSLRFAKQYQDTIGIIQALNNLGNLFVNLGENEKALNSYKNCVSTIFKFNTNKEELPSIYNNMAYTYYALDDKNTAKELYQKSLDLLKNTHSPYQKAIILKSIAEINLEENDAQKALKNLLNAKQYYAQIDNRKSEQNFYFILYKTRLALGDHEGALNDLERYQALQDSIDIFAMHKLITETQEKYDNEKLKKEKLEQAQIIQQRKRQLYFSGLGILILALAFIVTSRISQYRKKTSNQLRLQQQTINDGLNYGRYVKEKLMITDADKLNSKFKNHFILDLPKNHVGGDFYLIKQHNNSLYLILGDATGHGIPGAFISLSILNLFHQNFEQKNDFTPEELLKNIISQWKTQSSSNSKFEESFTANVIKFSDLSYSIACYHQKAIIISDNKYQSIGRKKPNTSKIYSTEINPKPGDWLILSSDGYYDQIGFETNKTYKFNQFTEKIKNICTTENINIHKELLKTHQDFKKKEEQTDDILVIGIGF
jgi:tetratricopeptide (TPR) repeat protein